MPLIDEADGEGNATSDSEPSTYLWDGVEVTTRPSQRTVELPSPDQPADD